MSDSHSFADNLQNIKKKNFHNVLITNPTETSQSIQNCCLIDIVSNFNLKNKENAHLSVFLNHWLKIYDLSS